MKAIMEILDRVAVSSLPEGDVDMLHSQSYDIVPLKGHSIRRPWYHQELVSSSEFRGKILLLPDVGKFEIELKAFDPALLANGICSRYPSDITIYKNRNRRINRYLVYVQYRMFSLRKNQIAFWCFSQTLIRKSHSYLVACMHSVDRNIYRKKTLKELRMLLLRLNRMRGQFCTIGTQFGRQHLTTNHGHEKLSCSLMAHYLKFYRVYIPKTEVKYRPLGVPTLAWRIFQKMWLSPILNYTSMHLPEDFHGYIPRRGCGTAWKSILKNTIHSANIYEVDFSNFFPSVDSDHLLDFMLNKWAIATPVAVYLYMLNQSLPIFLESKSQDRVHGEIRFTPAHQDSLISDQAKKLAFKLPEARRNIQDLSLAGLADMDPYFQEKELLKDYSQPEKPLVVKENIFSKGNQLSYAEGNTRAWIEAQRVTPFDPNRKLREKLGFQFKGNIGLPQGGTLSPYLSIMYLEEVFQKLEMPSDVKFVFYADDGLFYSDNKASLEAWINRVSKLDKSVGTLSYYNIRVNFEKSSWVKVDNIWKHPLKFLGLVFVPGKSLAESKLVASTRKGSTLEYSKELQELTSFEYSEYLVNMKNTNFIEAKLKALNSLPDSRLTRVVKLYYESILEIRDWNIKPSYLSYAYYLQKLVGSRPEHFIHQLFEGLINLNFPEGYSEYFKIFSENSQFDQKLITFNLDSATAEDMFGHYLPHLESILYSPSSIAKHVSASRLLLRKSVSLPIPDSSFVRPESVDSSIMKEVGKGVVSLFQLDVAIDDINPTSTVLKGQAVDPHPYIFLHTIFDTLKILSLRVNKFINPLPNDLYILRYFHKKYQFSNLIKSKYFGLILSRMYIGSLTLEEFSQDFEFGYVKDSLADYLDVKSSRDETLNIFTGSSYATREMVRLSSFLGLQSKFERDYTGALFTSRPHQRFVLFQEGILPPDSWDR